jgi:hypothetical protein
LVIIFKVTTYAMFEKYNASMVTEECAAGSGGEYEVQVEKLF